MTDLTISQLNTLCKRHYVIINDVEIESVYIHNASHGTSLVLETSCTDVHVTEVLKVTPDGEIIVMDKNGNTHSIYILVTATATYINNLLKN